GALGRRDVRPHGGPEAAAPPEPRRRRRGRPADGAAGGPQPAGGFDRDRAARRRRRGGSRAASRGWGGPEADAVLGAVRLPDVRALAPRARAAAVLVQFAVRRLPRVLRTRHPPGGERRPDPRRLEPFHPRGGDPAVGGAEWLRA